MSILLDAVTRDKQQSQAITHDVVLTPRAPYKAKQATSGGVKFAALFVLALLLMVLAAWLVSKVLYPITEQVSSIDEHAAPASTSQNSSTQNSSTQKAPIEGVRLAGIEVNVAEGSERIHRTNLVGMGVLPLQFKAGTDRNTLQLDGTELYDIYGDIEAGSDLALVITRKNGKKLDVPVTCRLDTADEVNVYSAGGVLQRFAKDFLAQ